MKANGWRDGLQRTMGELKLNTGLVLEALPGNQKASITECQGAPSPSLGTRWRVAFVGVSYDLCWRCDSSPALFAASV